MRSTKAASRKKIGFSSHFASVMLLPGILFLLSIWQFPVFSEMRFELAMDLEITGLQRALLSQETLLRCADIAENSRVL